MNFARSLVYTVVFYAGSVLIVATAGLLIPFGRPAARGSARVWIGFAHFCTHYLLGIRLRIEGTVPDAPFLYAVKHEAMYETLEMLRLLDAPATVFKAELTRIPVWSRITRLYGVIPVDRQSGAKALRAMLIAAREAKMEGRAIVIYPEGTRVPHGRRPALQPGFAGLYKALALPAVPVAVDSGRLWPRDRFLKRAGTVTFRFGEPIPPGLPREEIEARVFEAINVLNG